ncbi:MAG: 4Fe-4S binding protein [Candidatus Hydrogenedentota bacterium]|nr:MAG: 4Fe-4S binding protein [Candidatus Hydrogenedentota bacterium]
MNYGIYRKVRNRGWTGWLLAFILISFYTLLYWGGDLDRSLNTDGFFQSLLSPFIKMLDPLSHVMRKKPADRWFLYGFLYTVLVVVFGIRFIRKWTQVRYQKIRTFSVMFFQLVVAFLIPSFMEYFQGHGFYFHYFWPLKPEYFFPSALKELPRALFLWGVGMSFVAVPILTYFYGKRWYCSWVCGCGGLAETFGDSFRHLSSKSYRAWQIEKVSIYSVLVLVIITTALLFIDEARGIHDGFHTFTISVKKWYGFFIMMGFAGVVGTGFYPLMGSRVWCRFGCPQAAILGILQKLFSRFQITVNGDQCMACGNCSAYCEMGIDVRMYAMEGKDFVRASCVGCGMCASVCPRGVLKLENKTGRSQGFSALRRESLNLD